MGGAPPAPWGYYSKVGCSFRGTSACFHRLLGERIEGMVHAFLNGGSRVMVEYGRTGSALMNRVIGARRCCLCSCQPTSSCSPRGAKPNHWLPTLPSIKATIPGSLLPSHWLAQTQLASCWLFTPRGAGVVAAGIFVWGLIAANGTARAVPRMRGKNGQMYGRLYGPKQVHKNVISFSRGYECEVFAGGKVERPS